MLLPNLENKCKFISVFNNSGISSSHVARKYKFENIYSDSQSIFKEKKSNLIFISSRHDTHFKYVMESLNVNKNVFVEKPLCMSIEELEIIKEKYNSSKSILMVGFNRRFSPLIEKVISFGIRQTPVNINIRVNAGHLEKQHWVHDKEYGGGRVLGEMCHFIDLVLFVTDSDPKKISTFYMKSVDENYDSLNTIIKHKNGSISNISYLSNGGSSLSKEFIEISSGNVTFQIDDFKILRIFSNS